MSRVVAVVPIGVPAYRMQADLLYCDLDGAVHDAIEELQAKGVAQPQIAALLGLPIEQLGGLLGQLDGTGGRRRRSLRVWIDPAHGSVSASGGGLGFLPKRGSPQIPLLDVAPPTPGQLPPERFTDAARGDGNERIVVDAVLALEADVGKHGRPAQDHLLLLQNTMLVVRADGEQPALSVAWNGVEDEALTAIARETLLGKGGLDSQRLTAEAAEATARRLREALGAEPTEAFELPLDPAGLRARLLAEIRRTDDQLAIVADRSQKQWPDWLRGAVVTAARRGVACTVRNVATDAGVRGCGLLLVRDRMRAVAHSDSLLLGKGWRLTSLRSQACVDVHDPAAVARLCGRLGLKGPRRRGRSARTHLEDVAAALLRATLERQRKELPPGTPVALTAGDERELCEKILEEDVALDNGKRLQQMANGVAWERTVCAACEALARRHPSFAIEDERREPPGGGIDLDVILRDDERKAWWVLDAKHGLPKKDNERHRRLQIEAAERERWVPDGYALRVAIVFPSGVDLSGAELVDGERVRVTIDRLEALLLDQSGEREDSALAESVVEGSTAEGLEPAGSVWADADVLAP
jgi:hypothetical protein